MVESKTRQTLVVMGTITTTFDYYITGRDANISKELCDVCTTVGINLYGGVELYRCSGTS